MAHISNLGPTNQNVPPLSVAPVALDSIAAGYGVPLVLEFAIGAGAGPIVVINDNAPFAMIVEDVLFECTVAVAGQTVQLQNTPLAPLGYTDPMACNAAGITRAALMGDSLLAAGVPGSVIPLGLGAATPAGVIQIAKSVGGAAITGRLIIRAHKQ